MMQLPPGVGQTITGIGSTRKATVQQLGTAAVGSTFSAPPPLGNTTPNTGAFTTLLASSLDNTPIGATTPSTGVFTTLGAPVIVNIANVLSNGVAGNGTTPDDTNFINAFRTIGGSGEQALIPGNTYNLLTQDMVQWGYGPLAHVEVSVGGTTYVNGDTITIGALNGNNAATAGICSPTPVLTVTNAIAGVIQSGGVSISTAGNCSIGPSGSVIQSATSGAGTGAIFALGWTSYNSTSFTTNPSAKFTGGGYLDNQYTLELGFPAQILNGYQVNIDSSDVPVSGQQINIFNITARNTTSNSPVVALSSWGESASAASSNNSAWGYNGGCFVTVPNGSCWGSEIDVLALAPNGTYHGLGLFMDGYFSPASANAIEIRGNMSWHDGILFQGSRANPVSGTLLATTGTSTPALGMDWRASTFGLNEYTSPSLYLDKTITNWNTVTGATVGITGSGTASPAIYALPNASAISNNATLRVIGGLGGSVLLQTGMTAGSGSGGTTPNFAGAHTQVAILDTPGALFNLTETGGRNANTTATLSTNGDTPSGKVLPFTATTGVSIGETAAGTNIAGMVIAVTATTVTLDTAVSGDAPNGTSVVFSVTAQEITIGTSNNSNILINTDLDFQDGTILRALGSGALEFGNATHGVQLGITDSGGQSVAFPVIHGAASGGSVTYGQAGTASNTSFQTGGSTSISFSNADGNILQLLAPSASSVNSIIIAASPSGTPANVTANQGDLSLGTAGTSGQAVIALGATADTAVSIFTSSATGTAANNTDRAILANTVTSPFTLTMPAAPRDGQAMLLECDAAIVLTVSPNSGQSLLGTSAACSTTQGHSWHYRLADTSWRMDY